MRDTIYDAPVAEQVGAINQEKAFSTVGLFFIFLAGMMLFPLFPNQFISGPLVNALLIIVTVMLGLRSGIILSFVPSLMALFGGLLPALFMPFIPFIMLSNIILVVIFHFLRLKNYWLAAGTASVVKFLFLTISSQLFFNVFMHQALAKTAAFMMSWNQLYSALLGSIIAYAFLKTIKRF